MSDPVQYPAQHKIAFKKLHPDSRMPTAAHPGDAGYDLRSVTNCKIDPGERAAVPTGLAIAIPQGWAGLVLPRSGLARRHGVGLVNAPGLIDAGYRGELQVLLQNHDPYTPVEIALGDRIAQLVLVPFATLSWVEVDELQASERGEDGFGSTGRN